MANRIYTDRKFVVITTFIVVGFIYLLRIFYIQVIDKSYRLSANNNVLRYVTQYPARGLIYDRRGKLLVYNEAVYDLMVIPKQVNDLDTAELCRLLEIDREGFLQRMQKAKTFSPYLASSFERQISKETFGYLEEKLYRFHGFYVQPRTLRKYPSPIGAHIFGYVGEVTPGMVEKNPYYKSGDYLGVSGMERSYEKELRGVKGLKIKMVDVFNREMGSFQEGKFDTAAVMGEDLYTGLDGDLQEYGELLMKNRTGSIVALEPSTGEILCFVSSPTYDPNLLVGRVRGHNFGLLNKDPVKPLLNRALMGQYPPGSTFKMVNDMIGLEEGVLNTTMRYSCQGPGSSPIKCTHNHISPLDVYNAIEQSCNPFHWQVFKSILNDQDYPTVKARYDVWRSHVMSLGFGHRLNSDLSFELSGNIPSSDQFDKIYGKSHWNAMTVRSLAIGQGEILATPLQLANYAALLANRGFYYPPHVVKAIGSERNKVNNKDKRNFCSISRENLDVIIEGMSKVVSGTHGTARWYQIDSISMAGKTGTADNPHGKPHALYVAFAPVENPRIAIAVVVENAGFGATWAVPIATLMIEKYITRTIKRKDVEERMIGDKPIPPEE
ncbi:MAG: penicillin-binding protein 2 [Bacteroidales bacterium]